MLQTMGSSDNAKKQECKDNMQDENQDDKTAAQPQTVKKPHKKRTKKLVSQLKEQIEFYFGDSNLLKDRFLKQEVVKNENGYVKVKTIADFNRMKQMTDDIGLVIKAMKSSSLLQLNEEETMVKRIAPLPEAKNVDAETVYVENLPPQTDHDWLRKIFSQFGKVTYVSIPRFKYTSNIKGFAFIEFEHPNEATSAVQAFRKEEDEKDSQGEDHKLKRRKRSHSESEVESKQSNKSEQKRWRTTSESSADSQEGNLDNPKKKQRFSPPDEHPKFEDDLHEGSDGEKTRKRKRNDKTVHWKQCDQGSKIETKVIKDTETTVDNTETTKKKLKGSMSDSNSGNEESEEVVKKKKGKKRKRKVKEKKEAKLPHFRVIPKLEWMQLKQEYKKLQRESMQELKKQLQSSACKQDVKDQLQQTHSQNQEHTPVQKSEEKEKSTVKELPFTAGVVLHFKCLSGTDLPKAEIRARVTAHAPLAYIDVTEGTGEGYIRFHTAENCSTVLDNMDSSSGLELDKLTGEQEREYWRKINADRVARYQAKRQKKRGTEKVARKVDAVQVNHQVTHIRFDEE